MGERATRAFGPGRVNLIGEHTDYNGGLALPFPLTLGVTVTATGLSESVVEAAALDLGEDDRFQLDPDAEARGPSELAGDDTRAPAPQAGATGWRAYVRGTVFELQRAGVPLAGARLEIAGDLPRGAGLASSAALTVALALALRALAGTAPVRGDAERLELARLCQRVEQRWVGAQTGLLDQIAALCGQPEHATLIDFGSLETEQIPLRLGGHRLVIVDSGVRHSNAASEYNRRREECVEAARRMGKESLRDTQIQDLHVLPDVLARRARHVIGENGRVEQAVGALRSGDWERLGRLLDASHASLRDDYEVSVPEVEEAVSRLKAAGALGARLIGGGFGGSVIGLMPPGAQVAGGALDAVPGGGARLL